MHVVAIQKILRHEWLNTAMVYVHVEKSHAEDAWIPIRTRLSTTLPVPDQESGPAADVFEPAADVLDHHEHIHARPGQGDRFQQVARRQSVGPGAQEVRPRSRDRGRLARCSAGGLGICPASP
jgi:hypothetical protein